MEKWPVPRISLSHLAAKLLSWEGVCFNLIPFPAVGNSPLGRGTPLYMLYSLAVSGQKKGRGFYHFDLKMAGHSF